MGPHSDQLCVKIILKLDVTIVGAACLIKVSQSAGQVYRRAGVWDDKIGGLCKKEGQWE